MTTYNLVTTYEAAIETATEISIRGFISKSFASRNTIRKNPIPVASCNAFMCDSFEPHYKVN